MTAAHGSVDGGDWVAVSQLARRYGVSRQAVSKRVGKFRSAGKLATRGEGTSLRVHLPTYQQLVAETHDPAQDLRNRSVKRDDAPALPEGGAPAQPERFNDAAAREKQARAALAEMQLAQKRGELIPAKEIEAAAVAAATKIVQALSAIEAQSGKLYVAAKGGEEALQIELSTIVKNCRASVAESMRQLSASGATEAD